MATRDDSVVDIAEPTSSEPEPPRVDELNINATAPATSDDKASSSSAAGAKTSADNKASSSSAAADESNTQARLSFAFDLADDRVAAASTAAAKAIAATTAEGEARWLALFWTHTHERKQGVRFEWRGRSGVKIDGAPGTPEESVAAFEERWTKLILAAVKKIEVEDLGKMEAQQLWEAIPEEDGAGRGRKDLATMQKDLSVAVVFCESNGHVLLVGAKAKLSKKCFAIRNLLSHYHWRLSGRDVAFETMTASK